MLNYICFCRNAEKNKKAKLGINPVIQNLKIKTLKIKKLKTVIGENRSAFLDFS